MLIMDRPSSRAGMHSEKESRRSQVNGGTKSKHKSKSPLKLSYSSLLNNNRSPYLDRNLNCTASYLGSPLGGYSSMLGMDPMLHHSRAPYLPHAPIYLDGSGYHPGVSAHEPTSLPVYPWHQTARRQHKAPAWDVWSSAYPPHQINEFNRAATSSAGTWPQEDEDFASLPPMINNLKHPGTTSCPGQRRFSDPGVAVPSVPDGSSGGGSNSSTSDESETATTPNQSSIMQRMLLEMNALRENNLRLTRELEDTRAQLEMMRVQQASNWRRMGSEYQPGMLAEVREATRIREEAMMSRFRHATSLELDSPLLLEALMPKRTSLDMVDFRNSLQQQRRLSESQQRLQSSSQQSRHSDERRRRRRQHGSLPRASSDDDEVASSVSADSSRRSVPADMPVLTGQVHQLKVENQKLADELRSAHDSRAETDVHVQKLERLVGILRKKITAMNGMQENVAGHIPSTSEVSGPASLHSLTSSSSSGSSLDPTPIVTSNAPPVTSNSPQVTIHGPVTNL
ncbi:hypothetical protein B566_EDAN001271 [Ephemera danica]|nr:hypothetical protein B566_EDAN001271 [Ephemera danica]